VGAKRPPVLPKANLRFDGEGQALPGGAGRKREPVAFYRFHEDCKSSSVLGFIFVAPSGSLPSAKQSQKGKELSQELQNVFEIVAMASAVVAVLVTVVSALRSGAIRYLRFGSIEIEGSITSAEIAAFEEVPKSETRPFETHALASYYNQALSRATISFWFSLVFASIGFGVIIFAFFSHSETDLTGTIVKVASGTVIDAVAGLFFVQSTSAQKSMSSFFEKLRLDRLNAEAREMISEIEEPERRDQLRAQLILKYSGIEKLLEGGQ